MGKARSGPDRPSLHVVLLRYVLAAPNKLRVGTEESLFVEVQDYAGSDDRHVLIKVLNYPTKTKELARTEVVLARHSSYQDLAKITVR